MFLLWHHLPIVRRDATALGLQLLSIIDITSFSLKWQLNIGQYFHKYSINYYRGQDFYQ